MIVSDYTNTKYTVHYNYIVKYSVISTLIKHTLLIMATVLCLWGDSYFLTAITLIL